MGNWGLFPGCLVSEFMFLITLFCCLFKVQITWVLGTGNRKRNRAVYTQALFKVLAWPLSRTCYHTGLRWVVNWGGKGTLQCADFKDFLLALSHFREIQHIRKITKEVIKGRLSGQAGRPRFQRCSYPERQLQVPFSLWAFVFSVAFPSYFVWSWRECPKPAFWCHYKRNSAPSHMARSQIRNLFVLFKSDKTSRDSLLQRKNLWQEVSFSLAFSVTSLWEGRTWLCGHV